jgi:hypothetical protein
MPTLTYSGEQNVSVQEIQTLLSRLATTHQQDNEIIVRSVSLRLQDDGSLRVMATLEAAGDLADLETLQDSLSQIAVDLGFEDSTDAAEGIDLL